MRIIENKAMNEFDIIPRPDLVSKDKEWNEWCPNGCVEFVPKHMGRWAKRNRHSWLRKILFFLNPANVRHIGTILGRKKYVRKTPIPNYPPYNNSFDEER